MRKDIRKDQQKLAMLLLVFILIMEGIALLIIHRM